MPGGRGGVGRRTRVVVHGSLLGMPGGRG
jgi:hypothetical protein